MRIVVFACCLFASVGTVAGAQVPAVGSRVRVTAAGVDRSPIVGELVPSPSDSLRIALVGDTVAVPVRAVQQLEVANGKRRQIAKGAKIGALSGLVVGGALGALTYSPCHSTGLLSCYLEPTSRPQAALVGAGLGAIVGTLGGVLAGTFALTDRWQAVPSFSVR